MKDLTVKQKLIGMTVVIAMMIAGLSLYVMNRFGATTATYEEISQLRVPQQEAANAMAQVLLNARLNLNELAGVERNQENFVLFEGRAMERFKDFKVLEQAMLDGHQDLGKEIKGLEGVALPPCRKGGQIEALTKKAAPLFQDVKATAETILSKKKEQLELVNAIGWYDSAEESKGVVKTLVESGRKLEGLATDQAAKLAVAEMRKQEKNILERAEERYITRLKEAYQEFNTAVTGEIKDAGQVYYTAFESIFDKVLIAQTLKDELKELTRTVLREKQKVLDDAVGELRDRAHEQMVAYSAEASAMAKSAKTLVLVISCVVCLLSLIFGWFISAGINRVLTKVIEDLSEGADQVAAASGQVSAASQSLAEGSSEQAASLEETSSSLEEMSSMTKQNAENAGQADNLMKESNQVVAKANESMNQLTGSMQEISKASEETSKIIKTIDEIAFQTNLLALNAAVEAARAGEAGAGFAVVADEVRNLAMRAADAAKNTANLIEGTVKKVKDGTEIVTHTNEAFQEVAQSAKKVGELVAEIAAASNEQAQGISQVNIAVAEMDKVVQATAANAEESASASEELNAQAEQMKGNVGALVALVTGAAANGQGMQKATPAKVARAVKKILPATIKKAKTKALAAPAKNVAKPEEVIPLQDSEFKDF